MHSFRSTLTLALVPLATLATLALAVGCPGASDGAGEGEGEGDAGEGEGEGEGDAGEGEGEGEGGEGEGEGEGELPPGGAACVENGWALGRARVGAAAAGEIAIVDAPPASLGAVGGIILLDVDAPQSVRDDAVAAGVPILRLTGGEVERALSLDGEVVFLEVQQSEFFGCGQRYGAATGVDDDLAAAVNARRGVAGEHPALFFGPTRDLCVQLGEGGDLVAAHRLKAQVTATVTAGLVSAVDDITVDELVVEHPDGGALTTHTIAAPSHAVAGTTLTLTFDLDGNDAALTLDAFDLAFEADEAPFVPFEDLGPSLTVTYASPVDALDNSTGLEITIGTRSEDFVRLGACPDDAFPSELARTLELAEMSLAVAVTGEVWLHPYPEGPSAGFTSPLVAWEPSTVTGLLAEPFTLADPLWSRTYVPGHHNFAQDLALEPRLEPGFDATALDDQDIAAVLLINFPPSVFYMGLDGSLRLAP